MWLEKLSSSPPPKPQGSQVLRDGESRNRDPLQAEEHSEAQELLFPGELFTLK